MPEDLTDGPSASGVRTRWAINVPASTKMDNSYDSLRGRATPHTASVIASGRVRYWCGIALIFIGIVVFNGSHALFVASLPGQPYAHLRSLVWVLDGLGAVVVLVGMAGVISSPFRIKNRP